MEFKIGQHDALPKIHATLSADFDTAYPAAEQIVYNAGNTIKLYIKIAGAWVSRDATVEENIDDGKSVRVSVVLDPSDVSKAGKYLCYFRNETLKLSFPITEPGSIIVWEKGHTAQ